MHTVIVLSEHAERYRELIGRRPPQAVELHYAGTLEAALPHAGAADILFGAPDLLAALLPSCPRLHWAQSSWAGIRPLLECARSDYILTGVKGIFGDPMTEFVLAWLLALERNIPTRFQATHWDPRRDGQIAGKTLGIMGTGSIGAAVAAGCRHLGLRTRGLNSDGRDVDGFDRCWPSGQRLAFAADLDYLVSVLPDTAATGGLIDGALLDRLAPQAILINAGRGNAVVTEHVLAALASGRLRHAVLDVLPEEPLPRDDPLWQIPGLSITSHTSAPTPGEAIIGVFLDNLGRFQRGEPLLHQVDLSRGY